MNDPQQHDQRGDDGQPGDIPPAPPGPPPAVVGSGTGPDTPDALKPVFVVVKADSERPKTTTNYDEALASAKELAATNPGNAYMVFKAVTKVALPAPVKPDVAVTPIG